MHAPRWFRWLILGAFALALLRGVSLLTHAPLLAIANSYDQARYTDCFDLFPDRPPEIRPDTNSPEAPFEFYAFHANPMPLCYGSSELLVQAATVGIYRAEATLTDATRFSVRWIGALRLIVLLGLGAALTRAWWQRGHWQAAAGNALLLPLLLLDPGNSLYFATFYAEGTALATFWALMNLVLVWQDESGTVARRLVLAGVAVLLATSKIQHLVLPLAIALVLFVHERLGLLRMRMAPRTRRWQVSALLAGALLGAGIQAAQLARDDGLMQSIRSANRANVVFTGLLPAVADAPATLARLGLPADCARFTGLRAWQLPDVPETVCPGIERVGRLAVLGQFLHEPLALLHFLGAGLMALDPWIPDRLGHVAGVPLGRVPADFFTWDGLLTRHAPLRGLLLALPVVVAAWRLGRPGRLARLAVMLATAMGATLLVTIFGDGLADTAKQGHLIFNAALGFDLLLLARAVLYLVRLASRYSTRMQAVDLDQKLAPADVAEQ